MEVRMENAIWSVNRFLVFIVVASCIQSAYGQSVPVSQIVQCEEFSKSFGVSLPPPAYNEPMLGVPKCGDGNWLMYDSINFADGVYDSVTLSYLLNAGDLVAQATFRLDSPTGTAIATIDRKFTWGWPALSISVPLAKTIGIHSLYMVFAGAGASIFVDNFTLRGNTTIKPGDAQTYYVDAAKGFDVGNNGLSLDAPFKTISKAASVMKPGSRCRIRQGIYRETIRPLFTGIAGAALTFESYNGENVVIDGADPITGWTKHAGNIWKASMPWSLGKYRNQVLVDGKMAWVARCPNVEEDMAPDSTNWLLGKNCNGAGGILDTRSWHGRADPLSVATKICFTANGTFTATISGKMPFFDMDISQNSLSAPCALPAALFNQPANFFAGGLITIENVYNTNLGEITGSRNPTATHTIFDCRGLSSTYCDVFGPGWVSYVFGLLDSPNEWYRDSAAQTLYLWPPDGDDPSNHLVEAKRRPLGLDLRGKNYINIIGLRFLATSATLGDATHCVIDKCHFKYVTHDDIYEQWENSESGGSFCPGNGSKGVFISGHDNMLKNSSIAVSARSGVILFGVDNTVTNCHIHGCDYTVTYQAGILVGKLDDRAELLSCFGLTISHNTIAYCGRADIAVLHGTMLPNASRFHPRRIRISYNDLGPCAYSTSETGSINGQCSHFVDVGYNWFHGVAGMNQGYLCLENDRACDHWTIHHNVFYQGETLIPQPLGNWSSNGSADTTGGKGLYLINNTFTQSIGTGHKDISTLRWPDFMGVPGISSANYAGKKNNLFVWTETDTSRLVYNAPWKYTEYKFTDTANHDYSLQAGSPAIDKGVVVPGITESFQGAAPDLGAYEFGEPRWVAGADWQEQPWVYPPAAIPGGLLPRAIGQNGMFAPRLRIGPRFLVVTAPAGAAYDVRLYDMQGAVVFSRRVAQGGTTMLSAGTVACGMYVLRASDALKRVTQWKVCIRQ